MAKRQDELSGRPEDAEVNTGERRAPDDWAARELGSRDRWKHAAADALHGWSAHAHHENAPIQLLRADYLAALDAACAMQAVHQKLVYVPHEGACSQHAPSKKG